MTQGIFQLDPNRNYLSGMPEAANAIKNEAVALINEVYARKDTMTPQEATALKGKLLDVADRSKAAQAQAVTEFDLLVKSREYKNQNKKFLADYKEIEAEEIARKPAPDLQTQEWRDAILNRFDQARNKYPLVAHARALSSVWNAFDWYTHMGRTTPRHGLSDTIMGAWRTTIGIEDIARLRLDYAHK